MTPTIIYILVTVSIGSGHVSSTEFNSLNTCESAKTVLMEESNVKAWCFVK